MPYDTEENLDMNTVAGGECWLEAYEDEHQLVVFKSLGWAGPMTKDGEPQITEDAIVLRDDISALEKAVMLQRSYQAVGSRLYRIHRKCGER